VNVGIQEQHASLQKILKKVEAEKMDALRDLEDEKEASVESSRNLLLEDLRRIKLERKCLNEQVKMLQNTNKRIQEYETSLLQYLQADATKNSETIAKLQKEKNTIVETMNTLKDHLQMQLDLEKSLQSEATKQINDLLKELEGLKITNKEMAGNSAMELDGAMTRITALIMSRCFDSYQHGQNWLTCSQQNRKLVHPKER